MRICQGPILVSKVFRASVFCVLALLLTLGITESFAAPVTFYSTTTTNSDYTHWQVATNVDGTDGSFSSFPSYPDWNFVTATAISPEVRGVNNWIANNDTGTNGPYVTWTFFVFRQTFNLSGYDPTTANLQFTWAADDSGQVFADRGSWTPKYVLNPTLPVLESSLIAGNWNDGFSYIYSDPVVISSGFVSGLNTIYFFVEGNGVTDGFSLEKISFTANSVPEPSTMFLLGTGLVGLVGYGRRRMKK